MSSATTTTWEDRGSKSLPAELPAARSSQGWSFYLVLMALLVPVLHPAGPSQIAMLDALNAIAIVVFTFGLFASRARVEFPLIVPIALASIGSLIAVTNAESYAKATMTMVQDAYLYLWFVLLVAILKDRGDLKLLRVTWMWSANIAGAIGFGMLLTDGTTKFTQIFGARGNRAFGLFDGPNALADYLMMSLFVVITLNGQIPRVVVWGSFTFQFLALIATKSNGAMLSFLIGMGLWLVVRAFTRARSFVPVAGAVLLLGGLLLFGAWGATLGGVSGFREFQKKSFLGRFEQSAEGRGHIWERLAKTYARAPLGIGPGNSSEQRLSVGERERKKSARSKEAHSDYLGYLVERGPSRCSR